MRVDVVAARLQSGLFNADLSWGWSDTNILLTGRLTKARIDGEWGWGTYAGFAARGKFSMVRLPSRVH